MLARFFTLSLVMLFLPTATVFGTVGAPRAVPGSCPVVTPTADAYYCLLSDDYVRAKLNLSPAQESEWDHLKAERGRLRGASRESIISGSVDKNAWSRYYRYQASFLAKLSKSQRNLLDAAVHLRKQVFVDLQEKILLHKLML